MGAEQPLYGRWQNAALYLHVSPILLSTCFYLCAHADLCVCVCACRQRMEKRRTLWRAHPPWNWSLWTIPILKTRSTTLPVQSRFLQTYTKAVSIQEYLSFRMVLGLRLIALNESTEYFFCKDIKKDFLNAWDKQHFQSRTVMVWPQLRLHQTSLSIFSFCNLTFLRET